MKDLVAFLNACIDEDEAYLNSNRKHLWTLRPLREVAFKRAILADCLEVIGDCFMEGTPYLDRAWRNVAQMGAVYSDRDGYRPEWKPQPGPAV